LMIKINKRYLRKKWQSREQRSRAKIKKRRKRKVVDQTSQISVRESFALLLLFMHIDILGRFRRELIS
jgi:hypothetical protein